jgi:spore coat polysaccharide biosynthesis protein SpsF
MVHRGPLDDVAGRLLEAGRAAGAEAIVRISADSPLIDPEIVDHAVSLFRRERPDVVSNVVRRTFRLPLARMRPQDRRPRGLKSR